MLSKSTTSATGHIGPTGSGPARGAQPSQIGRHTEPGEREVRPELLVPRHRVVPERTPAARRPASPETAIHGPPTANPNARMRARRAVPERERTAQPQRHRHRRRAAPLANADATASIVGVVAEELHGDVPLLARRGPSARHRRRTRPVPRPRRAPPRAARIATNARVTRASCRRDRTRCLRGRASRSNSRRPRTPAQR